MLLWLAFALMTAAAIFAVLSSAMPTTPAMASVSTAAVKNVAPASQLSLRRPETASTNAPSKAALTAWPMTLTQ